MRAKTIRYQPQRSRTVQALSGGNSSRCRTTTKELVVHASRSRSWLYGEQRGIACRASSEEKEEEEEDTSSSSSRVASEGESTSSSSAVEGASALVARIVANPAFYLVGGIAAVRLVGQNDSSTSLVSTLLLSASPVVLLTLLSKGEIGKRVQRNLEAQLPVLRRDAALAEEKRLEARASLPDMYGASRVKFLGPLGGALDAYPSHLRGELPGDVGFDPLKLAAKDESTLKRMQELEILHARWAMLAAVGCIVPELLPEGAVAEPLWHKVGKAKLEGVSLDYLGIEGFRIAGKQGIVVIALCQLALMGGPEYARYVGITSLEPVGIFLPGDGMGDTEHTHTYIHRNIHINIHTSLEDKATYKYGDEDCVCM